MNRDHEHIYLINTVSSWDEPPRARHQLALTLAQKYRVVFIERNMCGPKILGKKNISDHLLLLTPCYPVQYKIRWRLPVINFCYQRWLFAEVKRLLPDESVRVINFDNTASQIHHFFPDVIYYCNDQWIQLIYARSRLVLLYWYFTEMKIIKKSRFCIGVSVFLVKKISRYNAKAFLIPTGLLLEDYLQQGCNCPEINGKNLVCVGFFNHTIDWSIVCLLASVMAGVKIFMVGPVIGNYSTKYSHLKNLIFTGAKTGPELAGIVANATVCIAPYLRNNNIVEVVDVPNKFWLYLFFGKPIVTTRIPGLKLEKSFVYQADSAEDFLCQVRTALKENDSVIKSRRTEFSKANSWDKRVAELLNIYEKVPEVRYKQTQI